MIICEVGDVESMAETVECVIKYRRFGFWWWVAMFEEMFMVIESCSTKDASEY